jgi:WD40 repeat protein/type II secretory pathway predicted ATPase ExeA
MYEDFFGLDRSPFELSPDPFFMYPSASSRNALATISQAISQRKGFAVMTGEVGTGKTLVLRCLFELWQREQISFAYFIGPRLSTIDFLSYITFELGIEVTEPTKGNLLRALYRFLLDQFENGLTTVLAIDEAHQVSRNVLEEIRLLTNFETAQQKLVQILLVGQPELDKKLDSTEMRALKQRIAIRCHLEPLGEEETYAYIARRLELAGADSQAATIFPAETMEAINHYSQGVPRLINTICDQALLAAYARQVRIVSVDIVDEVASNFRLESSCEPQQTPTPSAITKQTETPLQNISSGAVPAVNQPSAEVLNPNISSDQVETTASVPPPGDTIHNYGGTVFPLSEGPEIVVESSAIGECAGSVQEDSRIGLKPETLDESRRSPEEQLEEQPEEQVLPADLRDELVDSFEKDFRRAWIETENKTTGTAEQPISAFLMKEVEEVRSRIGADGVLIALCVSGGVRCVASTGDAPAVGSRLPLDTELTRECLETAQAVLRADVEGDTGITPPITTSFHLRSAVAVPIQTQGSRVGVIEAFSSRPSAFCSTHVAELQRVANLLAVEPFVLQMVNLEAPVSASTSVQDAQPAAEGSTLFGFPARASSSTEGQTGSDRSVAPYLPDALLTKLRHSGATFESQRESDSFGTDKKTAPRTWLAGVAALVFLALLFWFGSSRHRELRTFSDPAVLPPALVGAPHADDTARNPAAQPGLEGSEQSSHTRVPLPSVSPPSSTAEEKNSTPPLRVVPVEPSKSLATSDSAAAMPRGSKPPDAISNTSVGIPDAPAPVVEAIRPQPAELPVEPAKPAIPAAIPPSAPPMPIRAVTVSRPDFVLEHTLKSHAGWVTGVAFSSDGRRLASGSWDQTVKFWDVPTGQELSTIGSKMKEVQAVAFSRDGHWLAAENSSDTVTVWDAATGREIHTLPSNKPLGVPGSNWVYSIAFSPDGRWLASGVDDKTVRLWDVASGRMVRDLTGLRRSVMYAAFSPDGRWLASGDDDKNIRIWDASTGQEVRLLSGHKKAIYAVAFSPDGRWLASASADKTIKLWDVAAGREVHALTGHANIVTSLAFSPDGRWLATGSWDKTIKIWDVQTGLEVQTLVGHDHSIYSIAFDSSGGWLASGSEDGKINLWRSSGSADQTRAR